MGLAASQARLLSITQRLSDNELRAQLINNQKMRLNSESSRVSENYINALNKTNLVFANYDSEDKAQNVPLTFNNLTAFNKYNNQYNLTNTAGNVLISEDDAAKYQASNGDLEKFLEQYDLVYTTSYWDTMGSQLYNCEAFYSTPNQTGIVENLTYNETEKKWTSNVDGDYSFFSAEELKKMYEGTPATDGNNDGIASYAETVKTGNYTSFVKAYDTWNEELAQYRKEESKRNAAIEKAANQIAAKIEGSIITSNQITVNADGTLSTTATYTNNNFENPVVVNLQDYLPTLDKLGITQNNGVWQKEQDFNKILNGTITTVKTTTDTEAHQALYFEKDGTTYVQILEQSNNGEKITSYWLNTSSNDGKIYQLETTIPTDGSSSTSTFTEMAKSANEEIKDENQDKIGTYTITISAGYADNIAHWTTTEIYDYDDDTLDTTGDDVTYVIYPPSSDTSIPSDSKTTLDLDLGNSKHQEMIQNLAANYVNKTSIQTIIKDQIAAGNKLKGDGLPLSKEDLELINNKPKTSDTITNLITQLNTILKLNVGTDEPDKMDAILIALTSGTNLTAKDDGSYTLTYNTNETINLAKESVALINALVCDTLMDYFGEPVYGYMKNEGTTTEPVWVVAEEEARWYTNLFNKIQSCGYQVLAKGLANSTEWMQFAFENGLVVMEQINSEQNWQPITYTTCSDIIEQSDSQAATLAEAEYNKAMRQIESKDEMLDLELKNIDTEHTSLQSEYESVKKAMTGNIERTFQMYG